MWCDASMIGARRAQHPDVKVGVAEPIDRLVRVLHRAQHDLRVEVVGELADVLRLDRQLRTYKGEQKKFKQNRFTSETKLENTKGEETAGVLLAGGGVVALRE